MDQLITTNQTAVSATEPDEQDPLYIIFELYKA
jgi:hypothetical protein